MNKQLIITGDDYGLCESVNDAIEQCLAAGAMRATCVMMNMPQAADAARLRQKFSTCSVGVHWNLTQGRPVLRPGSIPTLVNGDGRFYPSLRHRWLAGKIDRSDIRAELRAQHERFCAVAGKPDFWNTHQNAHVFPGLFQLCVKVARELDIPAMRSHRRFTLPFGSSAARYHLRHPGYWLKGQVIARWSKQAGETGLLMPDGRLYMPGYQLSDHSLRELLGRIDWENVRRAVELVIHPATTLESTLFGSLTQSRLRECAIFREPALKVGLQQGGVRLVGFEALRHNGAAEVKEAAA